jgi:hypothetical protein
MKSEQEILLKHYLKKLKLPTIKNEYAKIADQCSKEKSS